MDLFIDGPIGEDFFGDGITAKTVRQQIADAGDEPIRVRINSPGGDVHEAIAIRSLLAELDNDVTGHIDGLAASAATFVLPDSAHLSISDAGIMMIHDPYTTTIGTEMDHGKQKDVLRTHATTIAGVYAKRTGMTADEARRLMIDETWLDAENAKAMGFVDEISGSGVAACEIPGKIRQMLKHEPKQLLSRQRSKFAARQKYAATLALSSGAIDEKSENIRYL